MTEGTADKVSGRGRRAGKVPERDGTVRAPGKPAKKKGQRPPGSEPIVLRIEGGDVSVEGESNPVRRAFFRWMGRVATEVAGFADIAALEGAVTDPSMRGGLLDLVDALPPTSTASDATFLHEQALARASRRRAQLELEAGGFKETPWVARHLGVTRQAVDKRRDAGKLLAIRVADKTYRYPLTQFTEDGVVVGLAAVLAAFSFDDPWLRLAALVNTSPALDEHSILDVLRSSPSEAEMQRVLAVAAAQYAA